VGVQVQELGELVHGIKSNRREGEGQRGSSGEGMRCSQERGKAAATDMT